MRNGKRVRHYVRDVQNFFLRQLSAVFFEELFQVLSFQKLHDIIDRIILIEKFIHAYNVRISVKFRYRLSLFIKFPGPRLKVLRMLCIRDGNARCSRFTVDQSVRVILFNSNDFPYQRIICLIGYAKTAFPQYLPYRIPAGKHSSYRQRSKLWFIV